MKKVIDNCTSSDREALFYKALKYSPYFGRIDIQSDGEDYEETYGNTNKNGNALYTIVKQWVENRG